MTVVTELDTVSDMVVISTYIGIGVVTQKKHAGRARGMRGQAIPGNREKQKAAPQGGLSDYQKISLQGGFDFEAPRLKQWLRNVLRILVPARPLA